MAEKAVVDRQTTCPFLLKFCYRSNGYHALSDFPLPPNSAMPSHVQIYTWQSCTLRELAHLLTTALPSLLPDPAVGTRLSFRLVYPDTKPPPGGGRLDDGGRGRYTSKEMGSVVIAPQEQDAYPNGNGEPTNKLSLEGEEADKTLADARFVIGDYVDCAVFPPLSDGSVAPRTGGYGGMGMRGGGYGGPSRENGFGRLRGGGFGRGEGRGFGTGREDFGSAVPSGEWRRGERLPEGGGGFRGGGGSGFGGGRGGRRGGY